MDLKGLTAVELGKKIQAKEVTVKEAVEACFAQTDKVEKEVNSFVSLQKEPCAWPRAMKRPRKK